MPLPAPWEKGGHVSGSLGLMHCSQPTSQTPSQRQQHLKPMELGVSPYACSLHHFPCQDVLKMWVQQQLACSGIIRIWHKHGDMWYISILSEKKKSISSFATYRRKCMDLYFNTINSKHPGNPKFPLIHTCYYMMGDKGPHSEGLTHQSMTLHIHLVWLCSRWLLTQALILTSWRASPKLEETHRKGDFQRLISGSCITPGWAPPYPQVAED